MHVYLTVATRTAQKPNYNDSRNNSMSEHHLATAIDPICNFPFIWGDKQEAEILDLKDKLTTAPVLQICNFEFDFTLETDASEFFAGAALIQDKGNGF